MITRSLVVLTVLFSGFSNAMAQTAPTSQTAAEDHQRMMEQLGIKELRRGGDANPNSPFAVNTDESKANRYGNLPDVLVTSDGRRVTTPDTWWNQRRPEIVEAFDREIYGRVPKDAPAVRWDVASTKNDTVGGVPVVVKQLVGHVDNTACPSINVDIQLTLTTPAGPT